MTKIAIPVLLVSIVMIAGIFAFMPIEKASTVHTTIQGTQLQNINSTFDSDLSTNATASCGSSGGDFLVFWTFTNGTFGEDAPPGAPDFQKLGISNDLGFPGVTTTNDIVIPLVAANTTSASGVVGGVSGQTITFYDATVDRANDIGDLALTVVCQSGSTAALVP